MNIRMDRFFLLRILLQTLEGNWRLSLTHSMTWERNGLTLRDIQSLIFSILNTLIKKWLIAITWCMVIRGLSLGVHMTQKLWKRLRELKTHLMQLWCMVKSQPECMVGDLILVALLTKTGTRLMENFLDVSIPMLFVMFLIVISGMIGTSLYRNSPNMGLLLAMLISY